jgi:hypothetical protein
VSIPTFVVNLAIPYRRYPVTLTWSQGPGEPCSVHVQDPRRLQCCFPKTPTIWPESSKITLRKDIGTGQPGLANRRAPGVLHGLVHPIGERSGPTDRARNPNPRRCDDARARRSGSRTVAAEWAAGCGTGKGRVRDPVRRPDSGGVHGFRCALAEERPPRWLGRERPQEGARAGQLSVKAMRPVQGFAQTPSPPRRGRRRIWTSSWKIPWRSRRLGCTSF